MKTEFEATLTGTDEQIDGIARPVNEDASTWEFTSIAGDLNLVIAKDDEGNWQRVAGTEPYLSSWIDEFGEQITS